MVGAGVWDLVFHRLARVLGYYNGAGASGIASAMATSGELAVNVAGVAALMIACVMLPRVAADPASGPRFFRFSLIIASSLCLPVICVSVFQIVSPRLVLVGYLSAVASVLLLASMIAIAKIGWKRRRVILALVLAEVFAAAELVLRIAAMAYPSYALTLAASRAYLLAEVLFTAVPIFAFFVFLPGGVVGFLRRPHLPAVAAAVIAALLAVGACLRAADPGVFSLVAFRSLQITLSIPGGAPLYIASLFLGTLTAGSLILPSYKWPPSAASRRIGFGLVCIWTTGVQPTHPYQFALMLVGFLYLARALLTEDSIDFPMRRDDGKI